MKFLEILLEVGGDIPAGRVEEKCLAPRVKDRENCDIGSGSEACIEMGRVRIPSQRESGSARWMKSSSCAARNHQSVQK